jgi:ParB/RepB/Spo0J family partition protein
MSTEEMPRLTRLKIDAIKVPPIRLSSELTEEERGEFEDSIRWDGIMNPIQVIEDPQGNFWLADGGNRLEVARKLGQEVVPVIVRPGTVEDAIVGSAVMNLKRGRVNPGLLAEFIRHLADKFNWTLEEIAERLQLSKSYVSMLHSIARDESVLEDLKAGKLTVDEAYERVKRRGEEGPAHSSVTELRPGSTTQLGLSDEDVKGLMKGPTVASSSSTNAEPLTAGSRGLRRTEYTLCGWCGKLVRKDTSIAQPIWIHIDEYDKALQALAKAKEEEDQAGVGPQSPQLEGSEAA